MNNIEPKVAFLFTVLALSSCDERDANDAQGLEGSWDLVEYVPAEDTRWIKYGDSILYQKHLSSDHFIWFKYNTKSNTILGMGGGTYVIRDGKYIENIQFFYPPGSSELGQSIPFDFQIKESIWYHKGFSKVMEVDIESGKLVVTGSNKIEERWRKTALDPNTNTALVGTWDLISYRDSLNGTYTEYPDFIGYMKLLTATHFIWVYYDMDGDEIFAAGSGPYIYDGISYEETIDMIFPDNTGQLGETIQFTATIDNNNWKHLGYLPKVSIDNHTGDILRDSSLIDEKWALHEEDVFEGIIF